MINESCEVPREDLDEGFNPCRKQVVENGELCQYAHMYDVMNERYDREEDTSYLNAVKRDKIDPNVNPPALGDSERVYIQTPDGVETWMFANNHMTSETASAGVLPTTHAVAEYVAANIPDISALEAELDGKLDKVTLTSQRERAYVVLPDGTQSVHSITNDPNIIATGGSEIVNAVAVAGYAPIPLPISKGGTGGNTPYVTDDLDNSAIFVMHDAPNDRYDAAPMSALTNYLATQFMSFDNESIPSGSDLNTYKKPGNYATRTGGIVPTIINAPNNVSEAFNLYVIPTLDGPSFISQYLVEYISGTTYYRDYRVNGSKWNPWKLLYPTPSSSVPNPLPVDQGGTGAQTRSLKTAAGLTLLPVIDTVGASGALNGYTSVTNIATFITTNNIRPEITTAFENHTADAVANNDLLPTNALMMSYVDGNLINYNDITVSGGGTSNIIYNRVRFKNNCIYGDCDFTVDSEGDDGGVKVNIIVNGTDINIPPTFNKFIFSNKPLLVHKSSNTIIEGKNIYNISNGNVIIQFNIGDFNTGEFIFIVDSVFTGYNQPM